MHMPMHAQVTFPPLTALEVRSKRIEGSYVIVEMVPHLCETSLDTGGGAQGDASIVKEQKSKSAFCAVM